MWYEVEYASLVTWRTKLVQAQSPEEAAEKIKGEYPEFEIAVGQVKEFAEE